MGAIMNRTEAVVNAFLDDIAAHPDDPTPRLIFADWLEEAGQLLWPAALRGESVYAPNGEDHAVARLRGVIGDTPRVCVGYIGEAIDDVAGRVGLGMHHGLATAIRCSIETWWQHGAKLVRALPLAKVRLAGFVPKVFGGKAHVFWSAMVEQELRGGGKALDVLGAKEHWLPLAWSGGDTTVFHGEWFDSTDAAHAEVSARVLRWARGQQ